MFKQIIIGDTIFLILIIYQSVENKCAVWNNIYTSIIKFIIGICIYVNNVNKNKKYWKHRTLPTIHDYFLNIDYSAHP